MQDSDWILIIAVAEFALIVTLALVVIGVRVFRRARRETSAAEGLVSKVKSGEASRRSELETLLANNYGLKGEALKDKAHELQRVEKRFYEQFIHTYLSRDTEGLLKTDERLQVVIGACLGMQAAPGVAAAEPDTGAGSADIANLKSMISNQSTEMTVYREALNKVFSEYTAMFGVHLDPRRQLTAKEIMARLESGQLSGEDGPAEPESDPQPD